VIEKGAFDPLRVVDSHSPNSACYVSQTKFKKLLSFRPSFVVTGWMDGWMHAYMQGWFYVGAGGHVPLPQIHLLLPARFKS